MSAYIARRILLMIPTLLGILFVSFVVVQFAPGGPVERVIAQLSGADDHVLVQNSPLDDGARLDVHPVEEHRILHERLRLDRRPWADNAALDAGAGDQAAQRHQ